MSTSDFDAWHKNEGMCTRRHKDYKCNIPLQWYEHCNPPRNVYSSIYVRLRFVRIKIY